MLPLFRYSLLALFFPPFQTTFVHVRLSLDNNLGRETRVAEKSGEAVVFLFRFSPERRSSKTILSILDRFVKSWPSTIAFDQSRSKI